MKVDIENSMRRATISRMQEQYILLPLLDISTNLLADTWVALQGTRFCTWKTLLVGNRVRQLGSPAFRIWESKVQVRSASSLDEVFLGFYRSWIKDSRLLEGPGGTTSSADAHSGFAFAGFSHSISCLVALHGVHRDL